MKIGEHSRRQVLQRIAAVTGLPLSSSLTGALLAGCSAQPDMALVKNGLSKDGLKLVTHMVDMIIPDTDTPGAVAAGVPAFINLMVSEWFTQAERAAFESGLKNVDEAAQMYAGKYFLRCSEDEQKNVLKVLDEKAYAGKGGFFKTLKTLTVSGYYTSEIGASEELRYEAVPGPFQGCIPFADVGRTWAT